jgi:hypothetical protein
MRFLLRLLVLGVGRSLVSLLVSVLCQRGCLMGRLCVGLIIDLVGSLLGCRDWFEPQVRAGLIYG